MSEATLKTKWRRAAARHGIWSKSMSPHQIPGCPDIVAIDCGASPVVRELSRTRVHWIEAKVADKGPDAFRASRDATGPQMLWIGTMGILGASSWWLILDEKKWLLVPWSQDVVTREQFRRKGKLYKAAPTELFEPEINRKKLLEPTAQRVEELKVAVAKWFKRGKR